MAGYNNNVGGVGEAKQVYPTTFRDRPEEISVMVWEADVGGAIESVDGGDT